MLTSTLRAVGGSIMMAIPKPLLDSMGLGPNVKVALRIEDGRLVIEPRPRPRYSLAELVAQCDADAPMSKEARAWDETEPMGGEAL